MFNKEVDIFKKKVEEEMKSFFGLTPKGIAEEIASMKEKYFPFCNLDEDSLYETLSPEYKEILVKYKTLAYFNGIYNSLLDLEKFLKRGI